MWICTLLLLNPVLHIRALIFAQTSFFFFTFTHRIIDVVTLLCVFPNLLFYFLPDFIHCITVLNLNATYTKTSSYSLSCTSFEIIIFIIYPLPFILLWLTKEQLHHEVHNVYVYINTLPLTQS